MSAHIYIYIYMWQGPFGIMRPSSFLIPFVSILVSLSVPNLSPYFSISIAILLSGCFRSKESPCLLFLTSLSIAQCSSSGGFGDRTQVPSVFVLVSLLPSHMWLFSLGASGAQYAPCPLSVSGRERIVFLLFPFRSLSQRFLHFSPHSCCSCF